MKKPAHDAAPQGRRTKMPDARQALSAAEVTLEEQARIFDISHDAIFMWREPGGIEFWNKGAADLYGYPRAAALGRIARDLLRTKFPAPWPEIEKELRAQRTWQGELIHHSADDREMVVSGRLRVVAEDKDSILVLESTLDITEMKRDAERLERRAHAQAVTARFSLDALQAANVQTVYDDAAHILRENLGVDFSSVFECSPDCKSMLLRSGVGWRPGFVGVTRIAVDEQTPTGRALELNQPIMIGDVRVDTHLRLPEFMREHGVVSSMAVVIPGRPRAFGVLAVDTKTPRNFSADDLRFLESIGNVLATAAARLKFEEELRETAARLRAIVDTAVDGIITIDERGTVETMNPAAERIFGFKSEEVVGRNVSMLMPEPYRSEHDGYLDRYRKTGERRIIGIGREVRGRRKDGREFPMDLAVSATLVGQRRIFTGLVRDITERKRLEQEILEISDHEQRRIGSDLHDDLCQRLAGIRFSCDALKSSLGKIPGEDVFEKVDKIAARVSDAIDRTRMLARGLSPVALESNGLVSALQELLDGVQKLFAIECKFESDGQVALNDAMTATHLYRITQEAINNALKHAGPSELLVSLKAVEGKGLLTIHDDGVGFLVDTKQAEGMGLRTIAYRASMIGANLRVESELGQGTSVICSFSLTT